MSRQFALMVVCVSVFFSDSLARADEEYDRLTARLREAELKFSKQEAELAKQVGWKDRSLPPTTEQSQEMARLRTMEPPRQGFFDDFYDYAEKHAGKPEAMEAWAMALSMSRCSDVGNNGYLDSPKVTRALDCLIQNHASDPGIDKAIAIIRRHVVCIRFESLERFYLAVEAKNKDKETVATCRLARAEMHQRPYLFRGIAAC